MATDTLSPTAADAVGFDFESQPQERVHACPVCGEGTSIAIDCLDRYGLDVEPVECAECGLVYLSKRLTSEGYAEFYGHWYRSLGSAYSRKEINAQTIARGARLYASAVADAAQVFLAPRYRRTLLDVGGSIGAFASTLRDRWGYHGTVLDPAPDELLCASDSALEVIAGFAEDFEPAGRKWDVVSLVQTVDHLLDPLSVLRKLHKCLEAHGVLVIDFVDYTIFSSQYGLQNALKLDHPLYFTNETARKLLAFTGFEVLKVTRTSDLRHILYICRPVPEHAEVGR